jgi:DNA primase
MGRIPEHLIEQVAQSNDIVELVGQYVALKPKGREFVGLCPFHDDKRPSMNVSPAKQIFKCFACGAGGGVFQFVMRYDKLTFPEAVRMLAERARIELPRDEAPGQDGGHSARRSLQQIMEFAREFYHRRLFGSDGRAALDYARSRGLTDDAIRRFSLGFAPAGWDELTRAAAKRGIGDRALIAAGLASPRKQSSGCYDRFRNRLIFPIQDLTGKTIAFGGRALSDEERAKYLNSPETPLFNKSEQLFGLNHARSEIASSGRAVVVEGYLDALIPMQAGVENVVATLGTSLTERHARLLGRYAREAVLVFDADQAGQLAAERALEIFLAQQLHVRVATIPSGKDPADYVLAEGPQALTALIDSAPDALEYIWRRRHEAWREAGANLADRRRLVEEFLALVVSSAGYGAIDELRRGQLAQHIAHMLNLPAADLQQQMRRLARTRTRRSGMPEGPQPAELSSIFTPDSLAERHLLEVLLNRPDLFDDVLEAIAPEDFQNGLLRWLAERIWQRGQAGEGVGLTALLGCEALNEHADLLCSLAVEGQRRGQFEQTLRAAVDRLLQRRSEAETRSRFGGEKDLEALKEIGRLAKTANLRRRPKIQ